MNSEIFTFRSEALYELKLLDAALAGLEKCLEFRKDHQKYLLLKAAIQYEKGDRHAYETTITSRNCTINKLLFTRCNISRAKKIL